MIENVSEGTDAVFSSIAHTLSANVETLVLQGSGNVSGTGNVLANKLHGNSGDNTLNGGAGADMLTGNAGNDTFVFTVGQGNGDIIVRLHWQRRSGGRFAAVRRLRDGGAGCHIHPHRRDHPMADQFRPWCSGRDHHVHERRSDRRRRCLVCVT